NCEYRVTRGYIGAALLTQSAEMLGVSGTGPLVSLVIRGRLPPGLYQAEHTPPGGAQPGESRARGRGAIVPSRTGGGESPRVCIEAGLRELAVDKGPDIRQLSRGETANLRGIMLAAETPSDWPDDSKAAAVLTVIQELIDEIENPRWKAAAQAAFRMPS